MNNNICSVHISGQVIMRGFISMALSSLMKGGLKNILVGTTKFQLREKIIDLVKLGQGVMPESFKAYPHKPALKRESSLDDNNSEIAIGDADFLNLIGKRIQALSSCHPDFPRLNGIFSGISLNKFNVLPKSVPTCMFEFMPSHSGHIFGNRAPAMMNGFRSFCSAGDSADGFSTILRRMVG